MARRKWNHETIKEILDGNQPFIQSGYTGKVGQRKIGEEWTDKKGTWRKTKNGIVRVNKQMDSIRELVKSRCSVCNMDIDLFGDKVDKKIFARTRMCFGCLEIEEQNLKLAGKYDDYEQAKLLKNKMSALKEFERNVIETIEYLKKDNAKMELVCSNGDIVTWSGSQNERLLEEAIKDLDLCKEEMIKTKEEITKFEANVKS
jgi:hypothetical protein